MTSGFTGNNENGKRTEILDMDFPTTNVCNDFGDFPSAPLWRGTGGLLFNSTSIICGGWDVVHNPNDIYDNVNAAYNQYDYNPETFEPTDYEQDVENKCYKLWHQNPTIADPPAWEELSGTMLVSITTTFHKLEH